MRIFLVRHGQSLGNVDTTVHTKMADHAVPLSDAGKEQALEAGAQLKKFFDEDYAGVPGSRLAPMEKQHIRLWTSPYARTRQTADGITKVASEWITDRREHVLLCEQQFGLFDGVEDEELAQRFPKEFAYYRKCIDFEGRFWARIPLGESRFDVAARVHQAFGTFQRDREFSGIHNIIVVCHGVTLRAFVMMWCHRSPEWFEDEPNPKNCAIRVIEDGQDRGYLFEGFARP